MIFIRVSFRMVLLIKERLHQMEPNGDTFVLHSEITKHLQPKLEEFVPQADGIVFIVDALDFLSNYRALTARTKGFIRKQLEKEIDKLRTSRSAISEADVSNDFTLGVPGEAFAFSQSLSAITMLQLQKLLV
ncbi:hypothetical protein Q3G72_026299 [Acer saccharum]|nr:hypothetical protein Q3G72_026299 [Acer saccharum]